ILVVPDFLPAIQPAEYSRTNQDGQGYRSSDIVIAWKVVRVKTPFHVTRCCQIQQHWYGERKQTLHYHELPTPQFPPSGHPLQSHGPPQKKSQAVKAKHSPEQ